MQMHMFVQVDPLGLDDEEAAENKKQVQKVTSQAEKPATKKPEPKKKPPSTDAKMSAKVPQNGKQGDDKAMAIKVELYIYTFVLNPFNTSVCL